MAYTEATVASLLDSAATGRTITLQAFIPGPTFTDVYAVGVLAPYAGRSRWLQISSAGVAGAAAVAIQNGLLA